MKRAIISVMAVLVCGVVAHAGTRADLSGDGVVDFQTTMDLPLMRVGDVGNAPYTNAHGTHGSVSYEYLMGKFEVTAGQYAEFLNAVAASDPYALYSDWMATHENGCRIQRSGADGSYSYSVAADWADRPVNMGRGDDAGRFTNWLTNGMPTGACDDSTTEDGSYSLHGTTDLDDLLTITRNPGTGFFLPTVDEWAKAAYYDPGTAAYFDFPTSSNVTPDNDIVEPDPGNNSSYYAGGRPDDPYPTTEVGEYENSASPYGTYDQGGNVWEFTDVEVPSTSADGYFVCGGSWTHLDATWAQEAEEIGGWYFEIQRAGDLHGFRVSYVPEPAAMTLLSLGGLALLKRKK